MNPKALKYLAPIPVYILAFFAFFLHGWFTWGPMIYAWVLIPLAELFIRQDARNMDAGEEELAKKDRIYDYMLYLVVPLQYTALLYFLFSMKESGLAWWEIMGRIWTMGLLCGTFGINVAHELGHRVNRFEQFLAKSLLLTSLYIHFFIEHNRGHHKHVATPQDPGSARYNEPIYSFYFRTVILSYLSAWRIANEEMRKSNLPVFHLRNEMLQAQLIQIAFVILLFLLFGWAITLYFLIAASIGALLLETVNYIEHYGLQRLKTMEGKYERALPRHSWNSNHLLGRLMLFELSRHSDHHYMASRKYQLLKHHEDAPQLPTGYPGSMLLSLVPPVWFRIMNKRIRKIETNLSNKK